ncbi:MAG: Phosphoserine aminotransferase [Candidatus Moanabacter tarae]|uniref:Phosphoserine aminotransferase n=1 Tax=Candidatus Moanibacter tarae TaxID=2200854 RepID=A0A2Z4AF19_9BACT|nr:MAG: Phosphoserine aminotransferase [Candidatus Moanabacter tarae]
MTSRVYNFSGGPAMLPTQVIERVQAELPDYQEIGASIIEISHRSKEFRELMDETSQLFSDLTNLPSSHQILYMHGGARMHFSALPLNLGARRPSRKALYVVSGYWSKIATEDAKIFGRVETIASSENTHFDRIPNLPDRKIDSNASYLHITSNNTIFGTRWQQFPNTDSLPLIVDATSEILSREVDYSKFGMVYAGFQKNLGPSGLSIAVIHKDLLGFASPSTPPLLNYTLTVEKESLVNTTNTFAIFLANRVLQWLKSQGGIAEVEKINERKAALLYRYLDGTQFYKTFALPEHRSITNVVFDLAKEGLLERLLNEAEKEGLYALKGHRVIGGLRASLYNAMPIEGVKALIEFLDEFERRYG